MLPYIAIDSPASDDFTERMEEALSPLDPHPITRNKSRETAGTEFFSVLYLDSPGIASAPGGQCYELDSSVGGTRPLRVKKKKAQVPKVAGLGHTASRRRRSTVSVPQSPRSLCTLSIPPSPRVARSDTVSLTNSSHPHNTISRIFLASSPSPCSPLPIGPPHHAARSLTDLSHPTRPVRPSRASRPPPIRRQMRNLSGQTGLHLNLGRFDPFDVSAQPGPSPPMSPAISLTSRERISPPVVDRDDCGISSQPLTPSRAPAKAAKLLGTSLDTIYAPPPRNGKKKAQFRPLPTQTLVEIERFFGETPRKPKLAAQSSIGQISGPFHLILGGVGERNVGSSKSVRHKGGDGSMWQDVEEEQGFAWLMSEQYSMNPLPLPVKLPAKSAEKHEDGEWGMEKFTSVLTLPKPKLAPKSKKAKKPSTEESFFDFGDDYGNTDKPPRLAISENTLPWSSSTESLQVVTPTKSGMTGRPSSPDSFDCTPPRADSPPRIKNRPPPLMLAPSVRDPRLPSISTSPITSTSAGGRGSRVEAPTTPFARPRRAPIPGYREVPSVLAIPNGPAVSALPVAAGTLPTLARNGRYEEEPLQMSYFEPDTPIEPEPTHKRLLSGGSAGQSHRNGMKPSGGWFKKVVKPLAGGSRVWSWHED